jgi:hypothetical protein
MYFKKGKLFTVEIETCIMFMENKTSTFFTWIPKDTIVMALEDFDHLNVGNKSLEVLTAQGIKGHINNPVNRLSEFQ